MMLLPCSAVRVRPAALLGLAGLLAACGGSDAKGPPTPPPPVVEAVTIDRDNVVVELMDSTRVTASVRLSDGTTSPRPVQWSCTRADLVAACGPEIAPRDTGSFQLIATLDGIADTAHVRIYEEGMRSVAILDPPTGAPYWTLQGSAVVLQVQIIDSANVARRDRRLVWSSTDTTVAVVRDTTWWNWQVGQWWPGGRIQTRQAGTTRLTITVGGQQSTIEVVVRPRATACGDNALSLDIPVGELQRFRGSDANVPPCLQYRHARDAGRKYLVFAERLPVVSGSQAAGRRGVFLNGAPPAPDSMILQFYTPLATASQLMASRAAGADAAPSLTGGTTAEWHVHGHTLKEEPPQRERAAREVRRRSGTGVAGNTAGILLGGSTPIAVGDTVVIPRLAIIPFGAAYSGPGSPSDRAVVRYVGDNLVFAEHLEMFDSKLRRANGHAGLPMPPAEYARIDAAYGPGQTQLDQLFGVSPTDTILGLPAGRELVVNTIMPTGVWGTAAGDMALIDYWNGATNGIPATLQDPVIVANQLIVHEMAHVRHFLHRPAQPLLLWSMEGVARFAEHLAFAAHVIGGTEPSRGGNFTAGNLGYPTQPGHRSHIEMPTTAGLGTSFFGGYSGSGYIFDYLADHTAAAGRDGLLAVRDLLLNAHERAGADDAVTRALGQPMTIDELITRARIALALDDLPTTASLPAWTQYLQFNLRASRPWVPNWPNAIPGTSSAIVRQIGEGLVFGIWIDGERATADQDYYIDITRGEQSVLSIVRIQ